MTVIGVPSFPGIALDAARPRRPSLHDPRVWDLLGLERPPYPRAVPTAAIGDDISNFFDAVGEFFSSLAEISWISLLLGLPFFGVYLTMRSRAYFNVLRAAYPDERIPFRRIWGAYIAAYGFNNVIPARGGDVIKLFLVKTLGAAARPTRRSARRSSSRRIFDVVMGVLILTFAFSQGVFPKPPDFAKLDAFDLSFFAGAPALHAVPAHRARRSPVLVGFALLSRRVRAFWARVRQGLTILRDRRRYLREVFARPVRRLAASASRRSGSCSTRSTSAARCATCCSCSASTRSPPSCRSPPAAPACSRRSSSRSSPARRRRRRSRRTRSASRSRSRVFTLARGFVALVTIFRFRSFKEVIAAGPRATARRTERQRAAYGRERRRRRYCRPWRASRTSVTASGKTIAMTARICSACWSSCPGC